MCISGLVKTGPQSHGANCEHTHSLGGTESSANDRVFCEFTQRMKGDTTGHMHRRTAPEEGYSVASLPVEVLQSHLASITDQKHSYETDLGVSIPNNQGGNPTSDRAMTTAEHRGDPDKCRVGSGHTTSRIPYQRDNGTSLRTNLTHHGADTIGKKNYDPAAHGKETKNTVNLDKMR